MDNKAGRDGHHQSWAFKQAYNASLDVSKVLDHHEMPKLLTGPFNKKGARVIIRAEMGDINSHMWAEKLLRIYAR